MRLLWEDRAWEDYCYWQEHDRKILKRINALLKDIQRNGYEGIGKILLLFFHVKGITTINKRLQIQVFLDLQPFLLFS